jgi:hypothetical protein
VQSTQTFPWHRAAQGAPVAADEQAASALDGVGAMSWRVRESKGRSQGEPFQASRPRPAEDTALEWSKLLGSV